MYKIRNIKFNDHPILKDLELNFCGWDGNAVDTVIFAGENGSGKSTVLNELYKISNHNVDFQCSVEMEKDDEIYDLTYYFNTDVFGKKNVNVKDNCGRDLYIGNYIITGSYPFSAIYSDVDINFYSGKVSNVTSLTLDSASGSRRSTNNLPTQIKQLLIDIQALDDSDLSYAARNDPQKPICELGVQQRMPRFTNAFNMMFDKMSYSRIENEGGQKNILFKKNGVDIPIDGLSSGEKQVVYRGCFLLKDVGALNGAFVFIDEPEISLHPNWQMKIMDYYKGIFTNSEGVQTSQIFAVTHSPFVIHNKNRKNDKVIILARDETGDIIVKDKPEYFKCDSIEAVQDAFSIRNFSADKSVVYLEGRTDEIYFKKAAEVFGYKNLPFEFQWVGYMKNEKDEVNAGKDALNKASAFLIGRKLSVKNVCLFDCDTAREESEKNNVYTRVVPYYTNSKGMKKGIENALVLDSIDVATYYSSKIKVGDYGDESTIVSLEKMDMCKAICALEQEQLKLIMANLKTEIDTLIAIFEET